MHLIPALPLGRHFLAFQVRSVYSLGVTNVKTPPTDSSGRGVTALHGEVREWILDGTLPPGSTLSQVELSQRLGVSRTPLREVLRMLQEEGLVVAETNQRVRVSGFDPATLDADYACRIMLETLALELTVASFTRPDRDTLRVLLERMTVAAADGATERWFAVHGEFHGMLTCAATPSLAKELRTFADRSIRYIRVVQRSEPSAWQIPGDTEHRAIVDAIGDDDITRARSVLAHHLARTALRALTDLAPSYEPIAVRRALAMVGDEAVVR
jgi:DNA-binding GntR family transcriptional regulator